MKYVAEPTEVQNAITEITDPRWLPVIAVDIETAPLPALVGYPRSGKKKEYKEYLKRIEAQSLFDQPVPDWVVGHIRRLLDLDAVDCDPVRPGLDPRTSDIFLFQIARTDGERVDSWVFNLHRLPVEVIRPLLRLDGLYIGHNIQFDLAFFLHFLGEAPQNVFCTATASRVLFLGLDIKHSLKDCAERFLNVQLAKDIRETFGEWNVEPTAEQREYAARDVEVLLPLYNAEIELAKKLDNEDAVRTFAALAYPTALIEYCGLVFDAERWLEVTGLAERKRAEIERELREWLELPDGVSITQRSEVLNALALKGIALQSLDKTERDAAAKRYTSPFFELYDRWSKYQKRVTTYGPNFLAYVHPLTGRIHPQFKIAGAATGRFACERPNLLNIPTDGEELDIRSAFRAPAGFVFGNADYAAMEQRIAADLSGDPALVELFLSGGDNHSITAALMFHLQIDRSVTGPAPVRLEFRGQQIEGYRIPNWPVADIIRFVLESGLAAKIGKEYKKTTRQIAKVVAFLYFYGGTPVGLAKKLLCSREEAEAFFARFAGAYQTLTKWFRETGQLAVTERWSVLGIDCGSSTTYGNLRRWFAIPPMPDGDLYHRREAERERERKLFAIRREAQNFPCQGGNALILAKAMRRLTRVKQPDPTAATPEARLGIRAAVWLPIYDEVVLLATRRATDEQINSLLKTELEAAANEYMRVCPALAEPNPTSEVWRKY